VIEEILKMSRGVIALGKAFFYAQVELGINHAYRYRGISQTIAEIESGALQTRGGCDAGEPPTVRWTRGDSSVPRKETSTMEGRALATSGTQRPIADIKNERRMTTNALFQSGPEL
jgi:hypothetical protein